MNEVQPEDRRHELHLSICALIGLCVVVLGLLHGCWIDKEWDLRTEKLRSDKEVEKQFWARPSGEKKVEVPK